MATLLLVITLDTESSGARSTRKRQERATKV
jgi:hypothetical protein